MTDYMNPQVSYATDTVSVPRELDYEWHGFGLDIEAEFENMVLYAYFYDQETGEEWTEALPEKAVALFIRALERARASL